MHEKTRYPGVYLRHIKKDGSKSYCYKIRNQKGKQVEVSGFKTAVEAKTARIKALNQVKEGTYITHKLTVKELCDKYLKYKKRRIKESSYSSLEDIVEIHIKPNIGDIKLEKLEADDIEQLMEDIADQISKKRANTTLKYIRAILEYGFNRNKLSYNPAKGVQPFPVKKPMHNVLSWDELMLLFDVSSFEDKVKNALAALAGLRRGEVFGVEWKKHIDFKEHMIHVRQQLQEGKITDLKTENAIRDVPMLDILEEILREWGEKSGHLGYLFVHSYGKREQAEYWTKVVFPKLVKKAGITPVTFHELRHTFGTLCAAKGVPVQDTAKYMGHSNIQITYKYYYHPSNEDKLKGMAPLNAFVRNSLAKSKEANQ